MAMVTVYFPEDRELEKSDLEKYLVKTGWKQDTRENFKMLWKHESGKSELINTYDLQAAILHLKHWERRATGMIYLDIVARNEN